jgi:hypothetical protein
VAVQAHQRPDGPQARDRAVARPECSSPDALQGIISREGCKLEVLARCLIDGFNSLGKVFESVQEFIERHSILVVQLGGRERFPKPLVDDAVLMRI